MKFTIAIGGFCLLIANAFSAPKLEPLAELKGHEEAVARMVFSPDGKTLYSAGDSGELWKWDVASGKGEMWIGFRSTEIWDLDISPDGKELAMAVVGIFTDESSRSWLRRLDVETGKLKGAVVFPDFDLGTSRYHPSGTVIFAEGETAGARFWKLSDLPKTGEVELAKVKTFGIKTETENGKSISVSSLAFTPDGKTLITSSNELGLRLWGLPTGKTRAMLIGKDEKLGEINQLSVSREKAPARVVACGRTDMVVWDLAKKKVLGHQRGGTGKGKWTARCAGMSPDGKFVISSNLDGIPIEKDEFRFNDDTGLLIWSVPLGDEPLFQLDKAQPEDIDQILFSPDGETVATKDMGGRIKLWKFVDG